MQDFEPDRRAWGESNKPQANLYEYITLLQDIYRHQEFQAIPLCDSVLKNYEC